ncbi:MAG TPA: thioredoxin domain-containing protein [Methanobacteriaceae archaeon]|nr:thioredoxin domain-containing protein [Methanobacteriaceae archaeon]
MVRKKEFKNHLAREKSPYLLQHVNNPVDWYPWGEEAFQKAKEENKPVFLSIGYSTCHWCHVMARESFQDPEVGEILNQYFVAVKVDREERPDLDSIYMTVCQMMTGSGGWPLTIILTPELKPFFAGTYFPKESVGRGVGLKDLLLNVRDIWEQKKVELVKSADEVTSALLDFAKTKSGELLDESHLEETYHQLRENFDKDKGGFGGFQKFPTVHHLLFLLRYWKRTADKEALDMVEKTLQNMRMGGIWDHVGFGFHRYAVDPNWLVPHFEKMLYDQALLVLVYTEAYQATHHPLYRQTAQEIIEYLLRDMRSSEGGFYSAEDADSEGAEGKFYLWSLDELKDILTPEEVETARKIYNVNEEGNFQEESTGIKTGANILHLSQPLDMIAKIKGIKKEKLFSDLEVIRKKLFKSRETRIHPHKDDKILTDWNGLIIAALARTSQVFNNNEYREAAVEAVEFIKEKMMKDGKLWHRYRADEVKVNGNLDDYAFLMWGLIELYEATFNSSYLQLALNLNEILQDKFMDKDGGGFYFTSEDTTDILVRKKEAYDTAIPSGNSVIYLNMLRLASIMEDQQLDQQALMIEKAFSPLVLNSPTGFTMFLSAVDLRLGPGFEVVISGETDHFLTKSMLKALREKYLPNITLILNSWNDDWLMEKVESLSEKRMIEDKTTAYLCSRGTCFAPVNDVDSLLGIVNKR